MANTLKTFPVVPVTNSYATVYTVPASTIFTVTFMRLANNTDAVVTVDVLLDTGAGEEQDSGLLPMGFSIAARDFIDCGAGDRWPAAAALKVAASVDDAVNLKLSGIEST